MREFFKDEGVAVGFKKELGAEGHICEVSFTTSTAAVMAIAIIIQKVAAVLGVTAQHMLCVLATVLVPVKEEESQTVGKGDNPSAPAGHLPLHKGGFGERIATAPAVPRNDTGKGDG